MTKMHDSKVRLVAALAALVLFAWPVSAPAEISEDAVKDRIAQDYGVKVLKVRRAEDANGRAVYLVTVMNPGGNFNEAFQVNTLMVDAQSGELIPSYHHQKSGVSPNEAPSYVPNRQPTNALGTGVIVR